MKIRRGGLVWRLAYGLEGMLRSDYHPPKQTNLCSLFWRCVLHVPLWMVVIVILAVIILIAFGVAFLGGKYPNAFGKEEGGKEGFFKEIPHLPVVKGKRIVPGWILIPPAVVFLGIVSPEFRQGLLVIGVLIAFLVGVFATCMAFEELSVVAKRARASWKRWLSTPPPSERGSGPWDVFVGFLAAKKAKVCPIVYITDPKS